MPWVYKSIFSCSFNHTVYFMWYIRILAVSVCVGSTHGKFAGLWCWSALFNQMCNSFDVWFQWDRISLALHAPCLFWSTVAMECDLKTFFLQVLKMEGICLLNLIVVALYWSFQCGMLNFVDMWTLFSYLHKTFNRWSILCGLIVKTNYFTRNVCLLSIGI